MDANGTRFQLLLGEDDWTERTLDDPRGSSEYHTERGELTLKRLDFRFPRRPGDRPPRIEDRRGAARDTFGNLYWIDADGLSIRVQSAGTGNSSVFWRPGLHAECPPERDRGAFAPPPETPAKPAPPLPLSGLAVTEDHFLAVGTLAPAGLLVFDLHAAGPPRRELWPDDTLTPFDLCARGGGGVWVLDRDRRRLWELDHRFLVVPREAAAPAEPREFAAVEGSPPPPPPCLPHRRVQAGDGTPIGGDPVAIEPAPKGRVLVLDRNEAVPPSSIRLLAPGAAAGPEARLAGETFGVVGHDMALVGGPGLGTLYVADQEGNQAFAFALCERDGTLTATLVREYFPMRLFGGKALVATPTGALYDVEDGWVPLVRQGRPRYVLDSTLYAPVFDSRQPDTVWHRLLLDACLAPGTAVRVESRAAEDDRELAAAQWFSEPPLTYRRRDGSELPFAPPPLSTAYGTYELLLQRARGRYLQLRLVLEGDGRSSPRLRALRVYHPRFSYLEHYLPKLYRDDPGSASFLDRFLANFEGIHTTVEDRVAAAHALFDPRTVPPEALDWLIRWFDFAADPTWHEERKRLFLRHAAEFFALRGTIAGIQLALRLALDRCDGEHLFQTESVVHRTSRIVERFRTKRVPAVVAGDPTEVTGPRLVAVADAWEPAHGAEALRDRWRTYVGDPSAEFPPFEASERWRAFARDALRFEPPGAFEPALWREFLAERYGRIEALDAAYGGTHGTFAAVAFPAALPSDGPALRDWYQFLAVALPARRAAHRFTVLLPIPPGDDGGPTPEERRAIALRVVDLQKPAHTTFDVKFFWAAFRVGEVRLGEDTLLGLGSRDPRLREPLVLGREYAGESYLGGAHAPVTGHVGRDPLNR